MRYLLFIFFIAFIGAGIIYLIVRFLSPNLYRAKFEEQYALNKRMKEQLDAIKKKVKKDDRKNS